MKLADAMATKEDESKPQGKGSGELESVEIRPAENGFTVSARYKPKKPAKGNEPQAWVEPESYVFESAEACSDYVNELLGE